ncbi:MAG: sulfotransferase domain-containing protein [Pseudomonadota bacterium]
MLPDFIIIGAMKCGTSTLADQLRAQPGIFVTDPKEPNFFSDDDVFAKGLDWYRDLFAAAQPGDLKGEASTHYTKRPTYPACADRLASALSAPKLIYMIRDPMSRAVSHYIHEWSMGVISEGLDAALDTHPELISYGCYMQQLRPYVERYGAANICVMALETMQKSPQDCLQTLGNFIGFDGTMEWQSEQSRSNVSSERMRRFPMQKLLIDNAVARGLRRALVPQSLRDKVKQSRQMHERPEMSPDKVVRLQEIFAEDYAELRQVFPDRPDLDVCYPFVTT